AIVQGEIPFRAPVTSVTLFPALTLGIAGAQLPCRVNRSGSHPVATPCGFARRAENPAPLPSSPAEPPRKFLTNCVLWTLVTERVLRKDRRRGRSLCQRNDGGAASSIRF